MTRYCTTTPPYSNGADDYSSGHSGVIGVPDNFTQSSDNCIEPEVISEVVTDGNMAGEERSKHDVESHGWEEAEESTCCVCMGVSKDYKDALATDDLEQAVECNDAGETNPTITSHSHTPPYDTVTFCILPPSNVNETEVPLGRGFTMFPSCAVPNAVQAETSNDFNVVPMEECPVVVRVYDELRQNGIHPLHSSHCGSK